MDADCSDRVPSDRNLLSTLEDEDETGNGDEDSIAEHVIDKACVILVRCMDPNPIFDCALKSDIFEFNQIRDMKEKENTSEKIRSLCDNIRMKGRIGYDKLKEWLRQTDQQELVEVLECIESGKDYTKLAETLQEKIKNKMFKGNQKDEAYREMKSEIRRLVQNLEDPRKGDVYQTLKTQERVTFTKNTEDTREGDIYQNTEDPREGDIYQNTEDPREGDVYQNTEDPREGDVYQNTEDPREGDVYQNTEDPREGDVYQNTEDPREGDIYQNTEDPREGDIYQNTEDPREGDVYQNTEDPREGDVYQNTEDPREGDVYQNTEDPREGDIFTQLRNRLAKCFDPIRIYTFDNIILQMRPIEGKM